MQFARKQSWLRHVQSHNSENGESINQGQNANVGNDEFEESDSDSSSGLVAVKCESFTHVKLEGESSPNSPKNTSPKQFSIPPPISIPPPPPPPSSASLPPSPSPAPSPYVTSIPFPAISPSTQNKTSFQSKKQEANLKFQSSFPPQKYPPDSQSRNAQNHQNQLHNYNANNFYQHSHYSSNSRYHDPYRQWREFPSDYQYPYPIQSNFSKSSTADFPKKTLTFEAKEPATFVSGDSLMVDLKSRDFYSRIEEPREFPREKQTRASLLQTPSFSISSQVNFHPPHYPSPPSHPPRAAPSYSPLPPDLLAPLRFILQEKTSQ